MITCPECGTKMLDSAKTCPMCGLSVDEVLMEEEASEAEAEEVPPPPPKPASKADQETKRKKWLEEQRQIQMELLGLTKSKDVKKKVTPAAQPTHGAAQPTTPVADSQPHTTRRPPTVDEAKRPFWDRIDKWAQEGVRIESLESKMDRSVDELHSIFDQFESNLEKMNELWIQVQGLETDGLEEEVQAIEELIKDPNELIAVRKRILKLRGKIAKKKESSLKGRREDDKRKILIERRIAQWKNEGFDVSAIEAHLPDDIDAAWKTYTRVTNNIKEIKQLEEKLDTVDVTAREEEVERLRGLMSDPMQLDAIVEGMKRITGPRDKRAELLRRKIAMWKNEGYVVTSLEKLLDGDLRHVSEEIQKFEKNIEDLRLMREELEKMDISGHEERFEAIIEMMNDPDNIFEIAREIQSFLKELERREMELESQKERELRDEVAAKVREWKDDGLIVDGLEAAQAEDLATLKTVYDQYKHAIAQLESYHKRLEAVNIRGFEDEVESLVQQLKDPLAIDELEPEIEKLEKRVEAEKEGRLIAVIDEFNKRLDEWREEGYVVKRLENVIDVFTSGLKRWKTEGRSIAKLEKMIESDLKVVWEEFNGLRADIGQLEEYAEAFEQLDTAGFEEDANALEAKLNNPDKLDEIQRDLKNLKVAIEKREKEKEEVKDTIPETLKKAKRLRGRQKYKEALAFYNEILAVAPDNSEAKFFKKKCELNIAKRKRDAAKAPKVTATSTEETAVPAGDPNCASCHGTGKCHSCKGTGKCYWCQGSGKCDRCEGTGKDQLGETCTSCGGSGECHWCKSSGKCYWCNGTGRCDRCSPVERAKTGVRASKVPEQILMGTAKGSGGEGENEAAQPTVQAKSKSRSKSKSKSKTKPTPTATSSTDPKSVKKTAKAPVQKEGKAKRREKKVTKVPATKRVKRVKKTRK